MAQTAEGKVKAMLKSMFRKYRPDLYWFCPVQCGYGAAGLDFHCVYQGHAFMVETKGSMGGKLTPRQEATKLEMEKSGAEVFVVRCRENVDEVERWIQQKTSA